MAREERAHRRPGRTRPGRPLHGSMTIVAFTESGRMRRLRVSKRMLVFGVLLFLILVFGSTVAVLRLFRGQMDLTRIAYLERENRSLTALLEGQAEQLSRLKVGVARLKEFEENLRVVSGLDAQADPLVGTGQARGARPELSKKR
jgi:hypothetical protein